MSKQDTRPTLVKYKADGLLLAVLLDVFLTTLTLLKGRAG